MSSSLAANIVDLVFAYPSAEGNADTNLYPRGGDHCGYPDCDKPSHSVSPILPPQQTPPIPSASKISIFSSTTSISHTDTGVTGVTTIGSSGTSTTAPPNPSSSLPPQTTSTSSNSSFVITVSGTLITTSLPASTSGTSVVIVDPDDTLTPAQIAGVAIGSVLGMAALVLFLWLLRRGTFGSGTLFGCKYGDARRAGWTPSEKDMLQVMRQKADDGYTDPMSYTPSLSSLPSYAAVPFLSNAKLAPPSRSPSPPLPPPQALQRSASPTAWSTSPSAFDKAYDVRSAAGSRSGVGSDVSTLVSEPVSVGTTLSHSRPHLYSHSHSHSTSSSPQRTPTLTSTSTRIPESLVAHVGAGSERVDSPAPTLMSSVSGVSRMTSLSGTGGASVDRVSEEGAPSTIDGVRISSWHSSDSEETELVGHRGRRY